MTKRRSNAKARADSFSQFLTKNPIVEIPTEYNRSQKVFSIHDMINVKPLTRNQERFFQEWEDGYNIANLGEAGTGKSYLAIYAALREILDPDSIYEKLIVVRSVISVRELGAIPGDINTKESVVESPYPPMFDEMFKKKNQYKFMKEAGLVEFMSTSYIRGMTFRNSIVVFDECQNSNFEELSTVITRLSDSSKIILCGDMKQNDLIRKKSDISGLAKFSKILNMMPSFRTINFGIDDIVRGGTVKEFLIAQNRYEEMCRD